MHQASKRGEKRVCCVPNDLFVGRGFTAFSFRRQTSFHNVHQWHQCVCLSAFDLQNIEGKYNSSIETLLSIVTILLMILLTLSKLLTNI